MLKEHLDIRTEKTREYLLKLVKEEDSLVAKFLWRSGAKISEICLIEREAENGRLFYPEFKTKVFPDERIALESALERIKELEAALRFYADEKNWGENTTDMRDWYRIESTDRGKRAREILKSQKMPTAEEYFEEFKSDDTDVVMPKSREDIEGGKP